MNIRIKILTFLLDVFLIQGMLASGDTSIEFDEAVFHLNHEKISVRVGHVEGDRVFVSVSIRGENYLVPEKALFNAKEADITSVRIGVLSVNPGQVKRGEIADHGFVVCFRFGGVYEHGKEDEVIDVMQSIRLRFSAAGFSYSELATPKGELSNVWVIRKFEKHSGVSDSWNISRVSSPWDLD